jgi:hypothetical protein
MFVDMGSQLGRINVVRAQTEQFVPRVSDEGTRGRIGINKPCLVVREENGLGGVFEQRLQATLAGRQGVEDLAPTSQRERQEPGEGGEAAADGRRARVTPSRPISEKTSRARTVAAP